MGLWKIFRNKTETNGKLIAVRVNDQSWQIIKNNKCRINYRFDSILMYVCKKEATKVYFPEYIG